MKSYTDRGYGEKTRVEFILNELKPDQRVTVEEKQISSNWFKRNKDRSIFGKITSNKKKKYNRIFRKKRTKTYPEVV